MTAHLLFNQDNRIHLVNSIGIYNLLLFRRSVFVVLGLILNVAYSATRKMTVRLRFLIRTTEQVIFRWTKLSRINTTDFVHYNQVINIFSDHLAKTYNV